MEEISEIEKVVHYAAGVALAVPVSIAGAYIIASGISAGKATHDVMTGRDQGLGFKEMYKAHFQIEFGLDKE